MSNSQYKNLAEFVLAIAAYLFTERIMRTR